MTRMILFLAIAIVLFSLAASASWYVQYQQTKNADLPLTSEEKPQKGGALTKTPNSDSLAKGPLVRPPSSPEGDRISQMALTLQNQQESLKSREEQVRVREKQMNLIHEEVKKEQKKLDVMRKEVQAELMLVQEKIDLLEKRAGEGDKDRQRAETQKDEIRRMLLEVDAVAGKNLPKLANIYEKMDAEPASQIIQQLADQGKLDLAATILVSMRERQSAGILSEIAKQDSNVAAQLMERMRNYRAPTVSPK